MSFTERNDCRLCHGPLEPCLDLGSTPLANEFVSDPEVKQEYYPLYLSVCEGCGHVQLPVCVDPKRLFPPDYSYLSGTAPSHVQHLRDYARDVSEGLPPGSLVVEIGSNDGTMLQAFQQLGFVVCGVDPAVELAQQASDRGLYTLPLFFDFRAAYEVYGQFQERPRLIVANHVFAHSDALDSILEGVSYLLHRDGVFVFEVQYLPTQLARGHWDNTYHEHLSYHHLGPLARFLRRFNLYIFDAVENDVHGGSIRVFASRKRREGTDRYAKLLEAESRRDFKRELRELQARILASKGWIAPTSPLYCYGAPAKFCTLAHALEFQELPIAGVFDDNPRKVGKYTPGHHFKVLPSSEVEDQTVILTAWNYPQIKSKFKNVTWIDLP